MAKKPRGTGLRGIGTCQFCGKPRQFKFGPGIASHGYSIEPDGTRADPCPGSGHLPAELSTQVTREWIQRYEEDAAQHLSAIRDLAGDEVAAGIGPEPWDVVDYLRDQSPLEFLIWQYRLSLAMASSLRLRILPRLGKETTTEPR